MLERLTGEPLIWEAPDKGVGGGAGEGVRREGKGVCPATTGDSLGSFRGTYGITPREDDPKMPKLRSVQSRKDR